jgi:hypothetical protein
VNGVVYVGSDDGNVHAFSLAGALADVAAQRVKAAGVQRNLALTQQGSAPEHLGHPLQPKVARRQLFDQSATPCIRSE